MRKKFFKTSTCLLASVLLLTGCSNQIPDMTREQEEAVGAYAAMMLLKYDARSKSRLVDLSVLEAAEASAQEAEKEELEEEPKTDLEPSESLPETEEIPVVQNPQSTKSDQTLSIEDFYELPQGITISYTGANVCAQYPEADENTEYFVLDATAGKSLLVLSFTIANQTGESADIDLFRAKGRYSVTVNGNNTRNALVTMLASDMSTFSGTIPAGESVNTVFITEMEQDALEEISTVSLKLKNDATTCTIQLQ